MELAYELRDNLIEEGFSAFDNINKLDIPFMEKIDKMTEWQMIFFSKMNNEFVKEIVDLKIVEDEYKKRFKANLESGIEKGEIRSDLNLDLVYKISKKIQEISHDGSWKELFKDYGEYVKQARTIIFFGLLTRQEESSNRKGELDEK